MSIRILPAGDQAAVVSFGEEVDIQHNNLVLALDHALRMEPLPGVREVVPALASLMVTYDANTVAFPEIEAALTDRVKAIGPAPQWQPTRRWRLPVFYGGSHGPHMEEAAAALRLHPDQLADRHAELRLRVLMIGFAPGLAYLGLAPKLWDLPRRTTILPRVPAGSVLVAARQTVVAATPIPTGWWVIGHSPVNLFDPALTPPARLSPGDEVVFERIGADEHRSLVEDGLMEPSPERLP